MFIFLAHERKLRPAEVGLPANTLNLAAEAVDLLDPWRYDSAGHDLQQRRLIDDASRLKSFATAIVENPRSGWWHGDLVRDRQIWLSPLSFDMRHHVTPPRGGSPPVGPAPQHPSTWWFSSTDYGGLSSAAALLAQGAAEWGFYPRDRGHRRAVRCSKGARIFEVHSAESWHRLAAQYPIVVREPQWPAQSGEIVPDWHAVAREWDAVHLSIWGLLTGWFVTHVSEAGVTTLWSWDGELTLWLREAFEIDSHPELVELRTSSHSCKRG